MVESAALAAIALLFVRTWIVQPFEVQSGSMAGTLRGPHFLLSCPDCGSSWPADAAPTAIEGQRAVCPNCGVLGAELLQQPEAAGDRLLVWKGAYALRAPRRFDVVAFRRPLGSPFVVKRLVGLPGETVQLKHGDLFVNDEIARKPLSTLRGMRVLVHDADYRPADERWPSRWQADPGQTAWQRAVGSFSRPSTAVPDSLPEAATDWLTFRHMAQRGNATAESVVLDRNGYNQVHPVLEEHAVPDIWLACQLRSAGQGALALRANAGGEEFLALLQVTSGAGQLYQNGELAAEFPVNARAAVLVRQMTAGLAVEWGTADRRCFLTLEGEPVFEHQFTPRMPGDATPRPLAIGSRGPQLELSAVRVYRDVHYTSGRAPGEVASVPRQLGADEYFVLGDNSSVAEDSRHWPEDAVVDGKSLAGKALLVYWPSRVEQLLGRPVQVPDPERIRYIW